jgi:hypothetical protein
MARDVTQLFIIDYAHEFDTEATLDGLGCGNFSGVLTACQ